jgi:hypothetical protein
MTKAAITLLAVALIVSLSGCAIVYLGERPFFASKENLTGEFEVAGITVRTYYSEEHDESFEIWRGKKRLYQGMCYRCYIGGKPEDENEAMRMPPPGQDITGDGKPNLVVYEWTGGAHCCYIAYVFELGDRVKLLAEVDGKHGMPSFADLDGDSILEIIIEDWSFEYWPYSFAGSPAPKVILSWSDGKYIPDAQLMEIPEPSLEELIQEAERVKNSEEWNECEFYTKEYRRHCIPQGLFQTALDMIYGGHEVSGRQFIWMAWKPIFRMDTQLLVEFDELLSKSPYWLEIRGQRDALK